MDAGTTFELVPLQDPSVPARFPGIPRPALERALHLVGPDGTVREGAEAIEGILARLPSGKWFERLFRLPFARPLAASVYRFVARNRRRDACRGHCGEGPFAEGP